MLIDTHAHLDFPEFSPDDIEKVIRSAQEGGIEYIINIGASLPRSMKSVELTARYERVYAAVGIHPHEADTFAPEQAQQIKELARSPKVVGIGETGLDYHRNYSQHDNQRRLFAALIAVAKESDLPLVIHTRMAQDDTLAIVKEFMPLRAAVHCFSGDGRFLDACLEMGFFVSFTANITYKKADDLRAVAKDAPLDRIMVETDAPFLPPEGMRGKRNEPLCVRAVAEEIARIKGIGAGEVAEATTRNAKEFFGLP